MQRMPVRDIIVVGASAGGLEALARLVRGLPPDLPASVLVAMHTVPTSRGALPRILARSGPLPAAAAEDGQAIQPGRIYTAPPDRHLLLEDGHLRLTWGPKQHLARPAIDPLFV